MKPVKLFNRNFSMMIIGQIISLFGNAILRFALPLYILDATGSAAVFGGILALSMIPTVLLSPIGGVMADRFPRQRIMYLLDFATAALVAAFLFIFALGGGIGAVAAMMMLLSVIQACYQPSVMSAIPLLSSDENLMAANGVAMQVQAVSTLLGPILGGVLYAAFGVFPILAVGAVCFFASAVLEIFIRIPFEKPERSGGALRQIKADLGADAMTSYFIIAVCMLLGMACAALFSIFAQTYFQQVTPGPLLGKVSSFVSAICVCAMPLGQAMYGILFEAFSAQAWAVVALGLAATLILALLTGRLLSGLPKADASAPLEENA